MARKLNEITKNPNPLSNYKIFIDKCIRKIRCEVLHQTTTTNKPATSSYSLHLADTTAGIDDIIPSPQTTQLSSGSKKDDRGLYLAVPTTGTTVLSLDVRHSISLSLVHVYREN